MDRSSNLQREIKNNIISMIDQLDFSKQESAYSNTSNEGKKRSKHEEDAHADSHHHKQPRYGGRPQGSQKQGEKPHKGGSYGYYNNSG